MGDDAAMMGDAAVDYEKAARRAGVDLDLEPIRPGNFDAAVQAGRLLYVSGTLALAPGGNGIAHAGRLGEGVDGGLSLEEGQASAQGAAGVILAVVHHHLGSLSRVHRVVRLTGYVASNPGFNEQSAVVNGASDLMVEVFGEAGRHARSAVGVAELPLGASVELEAIFEINEHPS